MSPATSWASKGPRTLQIQRPSRKGGLQEAAQHLVGVEEFSAIPGPRRRACRVARDGRSPSRLVGRVEREQALAGRDDGSKPGVLHHRRHPERQVAGGPAREPAAAAGDVGVLGDAPLAERAGQVVAVDPRVGETSTVADLPAVPAQPVAGPGRSGRPPAAADACRQSMNRSNSALFPLYADPVDDRPFSVGSQDATVVSTRRRSATGTAASRSSRARRLPRRHPVEQPGRDAAVRRPDVLAEGEEDVVPAQHVDPARSSARGGAGQIVGDRTPGCTPGRCR